jgi:hypothetical protein
MSITLLLNRMTYYVCILHENTSLPSQTYPFKDVALIHDKGLGYLRFPLQKGKPEDARSGLREISKELQSVLDEIPTDRSPVFTSITESSDGTPILVMTVPDSYSKSDTSNPLILQNHNTSVRAIMDEIRQGRVCHLRVHSSVRDLFFVNPSEAKGTPDATPAITPYFYEPAGEYIARSLALIRAPSGTPDTILHSREHYRIPMIGYHGTSETFVEPTIVGGLRPTKKGGMYGNNAYYFGSFYKAIRYSFRDSGYASMPQRTALYKSSRPAGFMEVINTSHIDPVSKDVHTDLIRDSPALIRFVLFVKNPVFMPKNAQSLENIDSPNILRTLPAKTSNTFLTYNKDPAGTGKTIFSRDYIHSQIGEPLFKDGTSGVDVPMTDDADLEVPSDSTREETTLRLYRAIHVATQPAFA